ncbi:MAG: hypothetical protein EPN40_07630 [Rhodanobacteraceae bacterium]|nr:MAG: hypothetical protein EPN40_07630 [Rhodanobacteraceae bacterium]
MKMPSMVSAERTLLRAMAWAAVVAIMRVKPSVTSLSAGTAGGAAATAGARAPSASATWAFGASETTRPSRMVMTRSA